MFALFVWSERRSAHPVIEPSLFQKRSFVVGLVVIAAFFTALTGFTLAFNLLMQLGLGWTPLHSGLSLIPWALGTAIGAGLAGAFLADKLGRATLQLGLGIALVGMVGLWWSVGHCGTDLTSWSVAPALLVSGFGSGLVFVPLFGYILGDVSEAEVGTGSGLLNGVQTVLRRDRRRRARDGVLPARSRGWRVRRVDAGGPRVRDGPVCGDVRPRRAPPEVAQEDTPDASARRSPLSLSLSCCLADPNRYAALGNPSAPRPIDGLSPPATRTT